MINLLIEKIKEKNSCIVVGLDPILEKIPNEIKEPNYTIYGKTLKGAAMSILAFNKAIIDLVYDIVPAIKPQIAFYECFGHEGIKVYQKTIQYAKQKGLIVIGDIKRGDIGSTSIAYANAHLGCVKVENKIYSVFDEDFITINPYLGSDSLLPFIETCQNYHKGIFILVKTSNPSSQEFQDLRLSNNEKLYMKIAYRIKELQQNTTGYSFIGCVVGATQPQDAKIIRTLLPDCFFLVPGYGKQGASGKMIKHCFNQDGLGALICASRSIIYAYQNQEDCHWREKIKNAALKMNDDINHYRFIQKNSIKQKSA